MGSVTSVWARRRRHHQHDLWLGVGMTVLAGWISVHGLHVLGSVGPAAVLTLAIGGAQAAAWLQRRGYRRPTVPVLVAALLSLVAASVHTLVCPEHFHEALLYGGFFAVAAAAQLAWVGLVLWRPSRRLLTVGLLANLAVVLLWAVTRTVGIPFGPEAGTVEAIEGLDIVATVGEVGIVVCCAWLLLRRRPLLTAARRVPARAVDDRPSVPS
jgi:hypothetical protein